MARCGGLDYIQNVLAKYCRSTTKYQHGFRCLWYDCECDIAFIHDKSILIKYRFQTHSAHLVCIFLLWENCSRRTVSSFHIHQENEKPDCNPWVERKDTDFHFSNLKCSLCPSLFKGFTLQSERFIGCRGPKNWSLEHFCIIFPIKEALPSHN